MERAARAKIFLLDCTGYRCTRNLEHFIESDIRGFPQRRISVLVNGVPLNDPESHEVWWIDHPDLMASTGEAQLQRLIYNIGSYYFTGNTSADDGFILPYGQNVSRTTYAALFAKFGTTYGAGDGSTTFGLPDCRGRVFAGKDDMGGVSANRLTGLSGGLNGDVLGATGGLESHILTLAQLAAHTHTGTTGTESADHTHSTTLPSYYGANGSGNRGWSRGDSGGQTYTGVSAGTSATHTHSFTSNSTGSDNAHNNVQPTIICNVQIYTGVHA